MNIKSDNGKISPRKKKMNTVKNHCQTQKLVQHSKQISFPAYVDIAPLNTPKWHCVLFKKYPKRFPQLIQHKVGIL